MFLVDSEGEKLDLPDECMICFPYPEGLDENSQNKYRIIIHHYTEWDETEVFKSEDGDIEFTKQGLCIRVSSLSPFEISWEEMPASGLPETGDTGWIGLWVSMIFLAGVVLMFLKRKTT